MKVAVTAMGKDLKAPLSFSFGRAPYFIIYDLDKDEIVEVVENPAISYAHGAGIAAANLVAQKADVLLTGNLGPRAYEALAYAGVKAYSTTAPTVEEAIKAFKEGKTVLIAAPTAGRGYGMGRGGGWGRGGRGRGFGGGRRWNL